MFIVVKIKSNCQYYSQQLTTIIVVERKSLVYAIDRFYVSILISQQRYVQQTRLTRQIDVTNEQMHLRHETIIRSI